MIPFLVSVWLISSGLNFSGSKEVLVEQLKQEEVLKALSTDPWWHSINGWKLRGPAEHPFFVSDMTAEKAFSSKRGAEDPFDDLVALVADVILSKPKAQKLSCQFPTKIRFLREKLPIYKSELSQFLQMKLKELSSCQAFEKWAKLSSIDHLEIILGSASTASPASLFGHLFLRVIYDKNRSDVGPGMMPFYQFAVMDEEFQARGPYRRLWSGIVGEFEASLFERPSYVIEQDQLIRLRRSFRRFRLNLSAEEVRHLMERVWEGVSYGKSYRYYFFSQNCAALLVDFLRPALLPEISSKGQEGSLFLRE